MRSGGLSALIGSTLGVFLRSSSSALISSTLRVRWDETEKREREQDAEIELARYRLEEKDRDLAKFQALLEEKGLFVGDLSEQRARLLAVLERLNSGLLLLEEKGKNLIERMSELRAKVHNSETRRVKREEELRTLSDQRVESDAQLKAHYARLGELRRDAEAARKDRLASEETLTRVNGEIRRTRKEIDDARAALASVEQSLAAFKLEQELLAERAAALAGQRGTLAATLAARRQRLEQLEAATASELPAEFIAALARVSARTPAQWLTWIPGWASLVTRTGLPMRAAAPQKRQRTRFAAYRAQHTWRILRMAAFVLCLAAVPAAGLVWAATADRPSQTVPAPLSTSTLPGAGSTARNASPTPGTGTGSGVVPPLVGTDQSGAAAALAQAGLHLGTVTQQDGNNPAGLILASSPAAGTTAGAGSPVDVTVASGLQTVPNGLVGHSQQQVSAALQGAGFTVTITTIDTSGYVTGYVLDVSPAPGTTAPVASAIAITVAQYTAPTPTPAPTPSGKPTPSTDP